MAQETATRRPAAGTTTGGAREAPTGNLPATTGGNGNAPARQPTTRQLQMERLKKFEGFMLQNQSQLMTSLPEYIKAPHFISVVKTALQNKPSLLDCTFQSLWNSCIRAAQDGLLPDGREGAIAPFGDNGDGPRKEIATWLPMIAGYRKKARNAGVKDWRVEVVYQRDVFRYAKGDNPHIDHEPYCGPENPGPIVAAYSIAKLDNGEISREVMTLFELNQVKSKSKAAKGPWSVPEFMPEMYKKTVARRHYKQLPSDNIDFDKLDTLHKIIEHDDNEFGPDFGEEPALPAPARQARQPADVLNQIAGPQDGAGETIEHDPETGEAAGNDDFAEQEQPVAAPEPKPTRQRAKPDAASKPQGRPSSASTPKGSEAPPTHDELAGGGSGPDDDSFGPEDGEDTVGDHHAGDAALEALDERPTTSPVTGMKEADGGPMLQTQAELSAEDAMAQRWEEGEEPKNVEEYQHYLKTIMPLTLKQSGDVGTWFNSKEQKDLRGRCSVIGDDYTAALNAAKEYRRELADKETP